MTVFVQCVDREFEKVGVSKATGLALEDADLGIRPFERAGGDSVVVDVQNPVAVEGHSVRELD